MKHIFKPRLYLYNNLLGKYDLIDKHIFSKESCSNIDNIQFLYLLNKQLLVSLNSLLIKQSLILQKLNYKKFDKLSNLGVKNSFVTLRNLSLFFYFDVLISSYFLDYNIKYVYIKDLSSFIKLFVPFYSNHLFFNSLGLKKDSNNLLDLFFLRMKLKALCNPKLTLNYYFLVN